MPHDITSSFDQVADPLRDALDEIRTLRAQLARPTNHSEPIAIVGASCRFPGGVVDPESLWQLVHDQVNAVSEIPQGRWNVGKHLDTAGDRPGKMYVGQGGFIDDIESFDADFFGITPREARAIDPQQRLLLETAYEALERAAIAPDSLTGTMTGVFVGAPSPDFGYRLQELPIDQSTIYQVNGTGFHAAAGRLSYTFGLAGPSVSLDTACSTSLVAVHLACQSLLAGESDVALAGGANILLGPYGAVLFCQGQLLARDGACKTFDAAADGFVRSEGCAILVLKRLADAERDGDPIVGLIRGSAVNSDGRSAGLTQPHGPAQEAVVRTALRRSGLKPNEIDYVETHGTGTPTGDPIEVHALGNVLGENRQDDHRLMLGSIKTNIGHPEAASGLAGLLKVILSLQHQEIPANLHFSNPTPHIEWDRYKVKVVDETTPWPRLDGRPRRGGISSFGFSGTNAHVIVEEAPPQPEPTSGTDHACLVAISARSAAALADMAQRHLEHLNSDPSLGLADVAHTLAIGREHHRERVAFIAETRGELEAGLRAIAGGALPPAGARSPERRSPTARVAFLFTGQGSQYAGMGRELYETAPVFRDVVDRAAALLDPDLDQPFRDVLFGLGGETSLIDETAYTQPALYTLECALTDLWRSWGVMPVAVLGHSVGEYAASYAAGVFGFEDGLRLVAARGRLMQALPRGGAMAAVTAGEEEVATAIAPYAGRLAVAGINGPDETVISGEDQLVTQVLLDLEATGVSARRLDVSHAFHSPLLDPMLDEFEALAATVAYAPPRVPLLSNVTGLPFPPGAAPDAAYWRRHAREAVRFAPAAAQLATLNIDLLLEVGPAPILLALVARSVPGQSWSAIPCLRRPKGGRGSNEQRQLLLAARDLYVRGAALRWADMPQAASARRLVLPTYPFQRQRHWMLDAEPLTIQAESRGHEILGERQPGPGATISFLGTVSIQHPAYLAQHVVHGTVIMPGAAYMEAMFAAGRAIGMEHEIRLEHVVFEAPLELDPTGARHIHTQLSPDETGGYQVVISSAAIDPLSAPRWTRHAQARLSAGLGLRENTAPAVNRLPDLSASDTAEEVNIAEYYQGSTDAGVDLGEKFQVMQEQIKDGPVSIARMLRQVPVGDADLEVLINVHPTMLDGIMQVAGSQIPKASSGAYVPLSVDEVVLHRSSGIAATADAWASVRLLEAGENLGSIRTDLRLNDVNGDPVVTMCGLTSHRVAAETMFGGTTTQSFGQHWEALSSEGAKPMTTPLVLLADVDGFAERLAAAVDSAGNRATLVTELAEAVDALNRSSGAMLLDCRALDQAGARDGAANAAERTEQAYLRLLATAHTLSEKAPTAPFCVLTVGALVAAPADSPDIASSALGGLVRTLAAEQTAAPRFHIDLEPGVDPEPRAVLTALALLGSDEIAVALRHGATLAQRLRPIQPPPDRADPVRTVLEIPVRGDFDGLRFEERRRTAPGPNEVEIEVRTAGLNFRDLINALGMYPAPVPPLGSECAGIVAAVGSNVRDLQPGDAVVAIAPESFSSHCLCPRPLVALKPDGISFAEAVTLPNAYLTAQLCLDVAALQPGQRVLVHAAAGGVGSALVRLARLAGLEVFATAGSDEKRAFALARGASHAFDSRSTAFARQIMEVTNGEGVDLVVNSLAGEFIEAGLRIVRPGGCFVEIGKQGLWTEEEAAAIAPGVRYRVEDLGRELTERPEAFESRLAAVMQQAQDGLIDPLPLQVFPLSSAKAAFRHMAAARHVGKIVLAVDTWPTPASIRADSTYLVTGGFGGVGQLVVRWLLRRGAGHVVILSRTGVEGNEALLAELNGAGHRVTALACDVGNKAAVDAVWAAALPGLPTLRGIFHAGGVTDDAPVETQDAARFTRVRRPKMDGACNLHDASRHDPLDCFVLFSSTAGILGSPGQANYATANAFLDGLAANRRFHGLPATSIGWGPWSEVGMAAGMQAQQATWARSGIGLIGLEEGIAALEASLSSSLAQWTVLALNRRVVDRSQNRSMQRLLGSKPRTTDRAGKPAEKAGRDAALVALKAACETASPEALREAFSAYLADEVARVLGFDSGGLDLTTPLPELGLDSLMGVQLRNTVIGQLGIDLPVRALLGGSDIVGLAGLLTEAWAARTPPAPSAAEPTGSELIEVGTL